jgi:hypothetical protein
MPIRRLAIALPMLALLAAPAVGQGRPDCATVVRHLHRVTGHDGAGTPDADAIAEKLNTDGEWVARCAASYGRRVKPARRDPSENDAGLTAKTEAHEYQELAREERDMQENYVQGDPDNYKDRNRMRGIDPDSSAEWEPFVTHEWEPYITHEWTPFILDDDDPGAE